MPTNIGELIMEYITKNNMLEVHPDDPEVLMWRHGSAEELTRFVNQMAVLR